MPGSMSAGLLLWVVFLMMIVCPEPFASFPWFSFKPAIWAYRGAELHLRTLCGCESFLFAPLSCSVRVQTMTSLSSILWSMQPIKKLSQKSSHIENNDICLQRGCLMDPLFVLPSLWQESFLLHALHALSVGIFMDLPTGYARLSKREGTWRWL